MPAITANQRGIIAIVACMASYTINDVLVKEILRHYPAGEVIFVRGIMTSVLIGGIALAFGHGPQLRMITSKRLAARSVFDGLSTAGFIAALAHMQLANLSAVLQVAPLIITALSVPMLGEKVGIRRWIAVIVGFLGVLVIIRPGMGNMEWAMLLPLGMACTSALYQINTRSLAQTDNPVTTLWYTALTGSVIASAVMPFVWQTPSAKDWALMVLLGALGTIGHFVLINAYARASASVLAPFVYTQFIWSIIVGYILFANLPDGFTWLGAAIVAASGIYTAYRERVRRQKTVVSPRA